MLEELPEERLGEDAYLYHPFYKRLFKVVAVGDLNTIRPDLDNKIVLVTEENPSG